MQVKETVATLKEEYKARYGVDHPSTTDEELVESLKSLRWLFDVSWDSESGAQLTSRMHAYAHMHPLFILHDLIHLDLVCL